MTTLLIGGTIFATTTLTAFALMRWALRKPVVALVVAPRLATFAPELADAVPFTPAGRDELRGKLAAAGEYRPGAAASLVTIQLLLAGGLFVIALAISLFVPPTRTLWVLAIGMVVAAAGYFVPRIVLSSRAKSRQAAVEAGMPLALDLLSVVLTAGGDVRGGIAQVARAVRRPHPVLADEMSLVCRHAELFSLGHAVRLWADRCGVPVVRDFARLVTHAEATGAGIAVGVGEFAGRMRATSRVRAEAKANRLGLWLLIATLTCFWSATAILLFSPATIQLANYRSAAKLPPLTNP